MTIFVRMATLAAATTLLAGMVAGAPELKAQTTNPCAPSTAAAKRSAEKPEVDPALVLRPKGTSLARGSHAELIKKGKALFESTKLSTNGLACLNCHTGNENFAASFATSYPHEVAMAKEKGGVAEVQLDEMIQFCVVVPMQAKPLRWNSQELAALTAYTGELQRAFRDQSHGAGAKRANPCKPANPCAPKR